MGFEQRQGFARQVADLNKHGQALNRFETVDEVVSLTLEAITIPFELADVTVIEVRGGDGEMAVDRAYTWDFSGRAQPREDRSRSVSPRSARRRSEAGGQLLVGL